MDETELEVDLEVDLVVPEEDADNVTGGATAKSSGGTTSPLHGPTGAGTLLKGEQADPLSPVG
jgi:hypothetical protein